MASSEHHNLKQTLSQTKQEFETFRRKTKVDLVAAETRGRDEAALLLIDLVDDCDRALEIMVSKAEQQKLREGVQQLRDRALRRFDAIGLKPFGEIGDLFDPRLHNAITTTDSGQGENESIVQVHCRGWKREDDTIIKTAMVTVLQKRDPQKEALDALEEEEIPRHRRRRPASLIPDQYVCPYGVAGCQGDCPDCQLQTGVERSSKS